MSNTEIEIFDLIDRMNFSSSKKDEEQLYKLIAKLEDEHIHNNGKRIK
jgi:hypothetical protein